MSTLSKAYIIGKGQQPPHPNLCLFYNFRARRYMVGVTHKGAQQHYMWGAFATLDQMQAHYLEHPLERMGNQPLHYHNEGVQRLSVIRHRQAGGELCLLFTIQNPLHMGGGQGTHPFIVQHDKLKDAVHTLRRSLLQTA